MLSKDAILAQVSRRTKEISSEVFGGDLRIRELARIEWRSAARSADLGDDKIDVDRWNAGLFAAGVIGDDGQPLFSADEVQAWPKRDALWAEIARIVDAVLELSEVGTPSLKSGDPETNQE